MLWIAVAGAAGSVSRYGVGVLAEKYVGTGFPWGTFVVNALGSLLLALLFAGSLKNPHWSPELKLAIGTGFMGAFTTFSTFSLDTMKLIEAGRWIAAGANVGLNVGVGLVAAAAGFGIARAIW